MYTYQLPQDQPLFKRKLGIKTICSIIKAGANCSLLLERFLTAEEANEGFQPSLSFSLPQPATQALLKVLPNISSLDFTERQGNVGDGKNVQLEGNYSVRKTDKFFIFCQDYSSKFALNCNQFQLLVDAIPEITVFFRENAAMNYQNPQPEFYNPRTFVPDY